MIKQTISEMQCNYVLGTRQSSSHSISHCTQFDAAGSGEKIWNDLKQNGKLSSEEKDENTKGKNVKLNFRKEEI